MNNWQIIIVVAIVSWSVYVLISRIMKLVNGDSTGCGTSCQSCPSSKTDTKLVTLDIGKQSD
ncbi:MAG: hypothetical protein ACI9HK_003320 [Pirellulaceae bacterium]|jgi:hypothetical protein